MRVRRFVGAVAVLFIVAACSSGGGSADGGGGSASTERTAPTEPVAGNADAQGVDPLPPIDDEVALPIVFVHGFAGSAQQYESQAMRFAANGYPQDRILAFDHDGAGIDIPGYVSGLEEVIDGALDRFDAEQVYLVGHSRGTAVSLAYLSDPERATKVAKYVAIDGAPCPEVVPCTAPTQANNPGQSHVEVATSEQSFAMQYEFLVGEPPEVIDIVPQRAPVEISGRAVNFPANTGREGATLQVWEVDPDTGARVDSEPHATPELGPDGEFGPVEIRSGARYEYVLSSEGSPVVHHLYLQPYVRSSHLVRLLSSPPDGDTRTNTNVGEGHAAIIVIRMREWYALDDRDLDGDQRDVLEINTVTDAGEDDPVNALVEHVGNGTIGLHIHDDAATPEETTLAALPYFSEQPFQSGIDVFMPASADAGGTITVTNIPRGDTSRAQTISIPNWPSSGHAVSVVFTDHPLDAG